MEDGQSSGSMQTKKNMEFPKWLKLFLCASALAAVVATTVAVSVSQHRSAHGESSHRALMKAAGGAEQIQTRSDMSDSDRAKAVLSRVPLIDG